MARDFSGSSQYVSLPANSVAGLDEVDMTMAAWVWRDSPPAGDEVFLVSARRLTGPTRRVAEFYVGAAGASDMVVKFKHNFSTTNLVATTMAAISVAGWNHLAVVYQKGQTWPSIYANGTAMALTVQPPVGDFKDNADSFRVGANAGGGDEFDGRIAEVGYWTAQLTANEVVALAAGMHPLMMRPAGLNIYMPLWGVAMVTPVTEPEYMQRLAGVVTGATAADHAPVMPFRKMFRWGARQEAINFALLRRRMEGH